MPDAVSNTTPNVVTDPNPVVNTGGDAVVDTIVGDGAISNADAEAMIATLQEQFADGLRPDDFLKLLSAAIGLVKEQTQLSDKQQSTLVSEVVQRVIAGVVTDEQQQQEILNNLPTVLGVLQNILDHIGSTSDNTDAADDDTASGGCCGGLLNFLPWKG